MHCTAARGASHNHRHRKFGEVWTCGA